MSYHNNISKITILFQQNNYSQAEKLLKEMLKDDPENPQYLLYLAESYYRLDKFSEAQKIIDMAISFDPENDRIFYLKSAIELCLDNTFEAEQNIKIAMELDPEDADNIAWYAHVRYVRTFFDSALEFANKALDIDPDNRIAQNTRARALYSLNKVDSSLETIENSLKSEPDNQFNHATYAYILLQQKEYSKAIEHFKIALQIDPEFEHAKQGLIKAIKLDNFIFNLFAKFSNWRNKVFANKKWIFFISIYFFAKVLFGIAYATNTLVILVFIVFFWVFSSVFNAWIIEPIGNVIVRFNKIGKFLLSHEEIKSANFISISLIIAISGLILYYILGDSKYLIFFISGLIMIMPLHNLYLPIKSKYDFPLFFNIIMLTFGFVSIITTFDSGTLLNKMTIFFILSFFVFQWLINYYVMDKSIDN